MSALPGLALPVRLALAFVPALQGSGAPEVRGLLQDGRFARAEARAAAEIARTDPCSEERVVLLGLEAEAARRGNRKLAPGTLAGARASVELAAELFGEDDARAAEPLLQLGALHCVRREWPEAKRALERSLALLRAASGGRDPREATALAYLAIETFSAEGDGDHALAQLAEAELALDRTAPGESPERAWIHDMRGNVLAGLDRTEDALLEYRASLEMRRRTQRGGHPMLVNTLLNVGTMQNKLGRLADARGTYEEVVALLEDGAEIAWTLGDVRVKLGAVCQEIGDSALARASFERALAELEAAGQQRSPAYAEILRELSLLAYGRREFETAKGFVDRALAIVDSLPEADPALRSSLLVRSAWIEIYSTNADWNRVLDLASSARRAGDRTASEPLAWAAAARGDLAGADELLRVRIDELQQASGGHSLEIPWLLRDRARLAFLRSDPETALAESVDAESRARTIWEDSSVGLDETSAVNLEVARPFHQILHPAVCAAARLGGRDAAVRVWDALLLSRDRVFRECQERLALARASRDPGVVRARDRLDRARGILAGLYVRSRRGEDPEALAEPIERARAERQTCESDLRKVIRVDRETTDRELRVRALARAIEPDVGLVRYCVADRPPAASSENESRLFWEPCYYAFVLKGGSSAPRVLELGPAAEIDGIVRALLRGIERGAGTRQHAVLAADLRRRILDPVTAALPGIRLVHLVPESELCRLPFIALCGDDGRFLVESGPLLHLLGSEADLLRPVAASGSGLLALGDPAADVVPSIDGDASLLAAGSLRAAPSLLASWAELPEARKEIEFVSRSWKRGRFGAEPAVLLTGADASETAFRELASGRRVIHLATHGYYEGSTGEDGGPGLRGRSPGPRSEACPTPEDPETTLPYLRSGIVLAHGSVPGGEGDGILTTEEVLALDLSGVEWVVLSACETGTGELRRIEGVLGLQRAARLAGARTVIASLWPVEDLWSRTWMEALYRNRFEEGRSTAEAVRAASLDVLGRLRHAGEDPLPRRWAGFVAVGDWR